MFKKILIGIVVVAVIALAGWRLFFSKDNVSKNIAERRENLTAYHMEATMDIQAGEDNRSYFVTTDYSSIDHEDHFRVSLLDKNINQEQIILRNAKGVFVLTPMLNQVYQFKGDWPLNSPKPYLYHSMLSAFDGNHEIKKMDDGYLVNFKPNYENAPTWTKEDMKFSADLKPLWINIYDDASNVVVKIVFSEVDFEPKYSDNFFDVTANMEEARKNMSSSTMAEESDLPLYPAGADVSCVLKEETEATVSGDKVYILTYEGSKSFTIVQNILEPHEEMQTQIVSGTMVDILGVMGYMTGNNLTYAYNGVRYNIYSDSLSVSEMIEIACGMEVVTMK